MTCKLYKIEENKTNKNVLEMIIKRINQDIREWCNKENVNNITQELSDLFNRECKLIDAQCDEIKKILLDISMPF
jgi:hypothetical protein